MKNLEFNKPIFMSSAYRRIPNYADLEKIGAGHDGIVYRYGDLVFKLLKYDIHERKAKDLMTFEKATYFIHNLRLNRITQPIDILLDSDGMYTGYVMRYFDDVTKDPTSPFYQAAGKIRMGTLDESVEALREDVKALSSAKVIMEDLNRGSYIYTADGLNMCDMDKFRVVQGNRVPSDLNKRNLNFFVAKALYYEMEKSGQFSKEELKQLLHWVKKSANSSNFLSVFSADCKSDPNYPMGEYAKEKGKMLIR